MGLKCKGLSGNLYFWPWNVAHPDGVFPGILLEERKIGIMTNRDDEWFMRRALEMAEKSSGRNEVPVGAVLVDEAGNILAAAGNSTVSSHDPAGHAEIRVLRLAAGRLANYRLPGHDHVCYAGAMRNVRRRHGACPHTPPCIRRGRSQDRSSCLEVSGSAATGC
jgi:pyrimidine deaminase RibD-like protein